MRSRKFYGVAELVIGILLVALAVAVLVFPTTALNVTVVVLGVAAILSGIADIIEFIRVERRSGFAPVFSLITGILAIVVGLLLLFNISVGVGVIAIIYPVWLIIHCIAQLVNLGLVRLAAGPLAFWLGLAFNIIGLLLGLFLLISPALSRATLGLFVAVYLLAGGIAGIVRGVSNLRE